MTYYTDPFVAIHNGDCRQVMAQMEYDKFLSTKGINIVAKGIELSEDTINPILYPFQRQMVQ